MKSLDSNPSLKPKPPNDSESFKIPEYDLEKGIEKVLEIIQKKLLTQNGPVIVEIAGGSASGKTSAVASKIKKSLGDEAFIFSMDDYYYGKAFMVKKAEEGQILNEDQPEALDLELFRSHLIKLKNGEEIQKPIFDLKESKPIGMEIIQPNRVIIVEGLFALNDLIVKEGDVRVFVDTGTHGRLLRRLLRDTERTGKKPINTMRYFLEVIEQMHKKYIQDTKNNADLVIRNEYNPMMEAQRSGLHETQLKFKGEIDLENLKKIGARKLSSVNQEDYYYNTNNGNLVETGEILRIRYENGRKIFTYKGPRTEADFRIRPKFEFEIDDEIEKKFLSIYGSPVKIIKKKRSSYLLDGVVFSIDNVSKTEDKNETVVGKFIEIESIDDNLNEDKIRDIILKLGFSIKDGLRKSYSEM
jgi:uridine kinase